MTRGKTPWIHRASREVITTRTSTKEASTATRAGSTLLALGRSTSNSTTTEQVRAVFSVAKARHGLTSLEGEELANSMPGRSRRREDNCDFLSIINMYYGSVFGILFSKQIELLEAFSIF